MRNQLNLIEVPTDAPSNKQKLNALKSALGIETHNCGYSGPDYPQWMAAHMPSARKFGYGTTEESDLFDCVSKVGRLMDESGIAQYGNTEREAVYKVCEAIGIPIMNYQ